MPDEIFLGPVLTDAPKLKREAAKRRRPFQQTSVAKGAVEDHIRDGWSVDKDLKLKTRLRRPLPHDRKLENQVWMLLYLLGYPEMSGGRQFQIAIHRKNAEPLKKQVDVFARDEETVIVAECKSSTRLSRKSLQKDIEEFANLKGPIAQSIKKHYGADFKPKIIWMLVTSNIAWSDPDKQRARGANISIVTERELSYYLQIANHLRRAARYQFLAEFLAGQRIPGLERVAVPAIRGKLGGKTFYSFVSTPRQMLKISFINHRSLNEPSGAPSYQRLITRSRLKQISRYIAEGGFFPTNILVNFAQNSRFDIISKNPEAGVSFGTLYLPSSYRSAWVIDGQHRLYGYAPLEDSYLDDNIMVVAFEQLKKEEEANLFVTINHEQKSVPKTLLDDLEGELKWGSEKPRERIGAISARLIGLLNNDIGEPLYRRVSQQGIAATEQASLTVPALKNGLRQSGLLGQAILKNQEYAPGPLSGVNDLDTLERARSALNSYLGLLVSANLPHWLAGRAGYFCTNVSLQAYLKLFGSLISYMESNKGMTARELTPTEIVSEIEEYLQPVLTWIEEATPNDMEKQFKVPFGSGGVPEYYYRLCAMIRDSISDFVPDGFEEWAAEQSEERVAEADQKLKQLNIWVQKCIFEKLKELHGTEEQAYFERGIPDKEIRLSAYQKSQDTDFEERLPLENYLDFIQYKKIVENKANWPHLSKYFDIPDPGEKGRAKNVKWMDRINKLRRISAHPTEHRKYKVDDLDYIDWIYEEFQKRKDSKEGSSDMPGDA